MRLPDRLRTRGSLGGAGLAAEEAILGQKPRKREAGETRDALQRLLQPTLARLTGWDIADIRDKMRGDGQSFDPGNIPEGDKDWWDKLWPDD